MIFGYETSELKKCQLGNIINRVLTLSGIV